MSPTGKVDIEVHDPSKNTWAQARYLAHGYSDCLWTDDEEEALRFIAHSLKTELKGGKD